MNATQKPVEVRLPSTIEDFEVGDRVVWKHIRMSFGTVVKIEDEKLIIAMDCYKHAENPTIDVGTSGLGEDWKDSSISEWRVFPNIKTLEVGDVLSTTSSWYTWDDTTNTRHKFRITEIIPDEKIEMEATHDPSWNTTLKGDGFSRNLEDAVYDWELEG